MEFTLLTIGFLEMCIGVDQDELMDKAKENPTKIDSGFKYFSNTSSGLLSGTAASQ